MFRTRLKPTKSAFECIAIYDASSSSKGCVLEYVCPPNYPHQPWTEKLKEFLIPCGHKSSLSEEYVLIFTDGEGKLEFVVCLLLPMSGYIICMRSFNPWFEFLHGFLTIINQLQLYSVDRRRQLEQYTRDLRISQNGCITVAPSPPDLISYTFPVPESKNHPFYHRYILEYYNTLSINNWIVIMESLLLEKSIIFYSNRFQRITSCILASLSLLYPLIWVHLIYPLLPSGCVDYASCPSPFVAGIHSCLVEKVKGLIGPDVRLVDLDSDTVYMNGAFGPRLPDAVRQWLIRGCNASHHVILKQTQSSKHRKSTAAALLVEPYLELMTILLGGYREAMRYTESASVTNRLPSASSKEISPSFDRPYPGRWHFDREIFIASRGRECQTYLRELLQSQMVIQFFDSRVEMLNSDFGMIPPDDFEEAISRVSVPPRSNLLDLLGRGRAGFSRFARKLKKLKKTRSNQKQNQSTWAHMQISSPMHFRHVASMQNLPNVMHSAVPVDMADPDPVQAVDSSSTSSSSSSPEAEIRDPFAEMHLTDLQPDPSVTRLQMKGAVNPSDRKTSAPPLRNDELESTRRPRHSLATSIFNAIPDIPPDWLQPKAQWSDGTVLESTHPPGMQLSSVQQAAAPQTATELFGTRKAESTKRNCQRIDLLHAFDPYCPDLPTVDQKPSETDLTDLLKELDPLSSRTPVDCWDDTVTGDLLR